MCHLDCEASGASETDLRDEHYHWWCLSPLVLPPSSCRWSWAWLPPAQEGREPPRRSSTCHWPGSWSTSSSSLSWCRWTLNIPRRRRPPSLPKGHSWRIEIFKSPSKFHLGILADIFTFPRVSQQDGEHEEKAKQSTENHFKYSSRLLDWM